MASSLLNSLNHTYTSGRTNMRFIGNIRIMIAPAISVEFGMSENLRGHLSESHEG